MTVVATAGGGWTPPRWTDVAWALVVGGLGAVGAPTANRPGHLALVAVVTVAIVGRRCWPPLSVAVIGAAMAAHLVLHQELTFLAVLATLTAVYDANLWLPPRWRTWANAAAGVGTVAAAFRAASAIGPIEGTVAVIQVAAPLVLLALAPAVAVALAATLRRRHADEVARLREHARLLELQQAQEVRLATAGERTRIARELHDVVAHSLGVIVAQADGGRYAAAAYPDAATASLGTISDLGRRSLGEMRELLAVLHDDETRGVRPAPGLGDLDDLVEDYRGAGLRVRLVEHGTRPELAATLGLTTYRVVQEALSNALRHAGMVPVTVEVDWPGDPLVLTITDVSTDGQPPAPVGTAGHGLAGMRERVAVHGGRLEAGPTDTGWRVRVELPRPREDGRP